MAMTTAAKPKTSRHPQITPVMSADDTFVTAEPTQIVKATISATKPMQAKHTTKPLFIGYSTTKQKISQSINSAKRITYLASAKRIKACKGSQHIEVDRPKRKE